MITFKCDLCDTVIVYDSPQKMEADGKTSSEYFGPFCLKNDICNDCYKKLSAKEAELMKEGKSRFYEWIAQEFGKKIMGKAIQNNTGGI